MATRRSFKQLQDLARTKGCELLRNPSGTIYVMKEVPGLPHPTKPGEWAKPAIVNQRTGVPSHRSLADVEETLKRL